MLPMRRPLDVLPTPVRAGGYDIAMWQKITDAKSPVHIYIEGDGHAFDGHGRPTRDPTPRGTFVRDLAAADTSANVAYIARPCQFVMSPECSVTDWTNGRFSPQIVSAMADVVRNISQSRPVILIGYSGGAMISGLIIEKNPDIDVKKWITIAGVLNHKEWTEYFGDTPLSASIDMNTLPHVPQVHYVAQTDVVVPIALTRRIAAPSDIVVVPNSTHNKFPDFDIDFLF